MAVTEHAPVERAQRFPIQVSLRYRRNGVSHWLDGRSINISRNGILFLADEMLPEKSLLDILIQFPLNATLNCRGLVIRTEESACAVKIHNFRLTHQ